MELAAETRYGRSEESYLRATRSLAGGVNSNFRLHGDPVPLFFERAEGAHLVDVDGNDYVDYALGMGPNILGHAPREVVAAVMNCLQRGQVYAGQHEAEVSLAERLKSLLPSAELVRLGSSGSEMIHAALRVARAATGRRLVVKFEGHYHGWLDGIFLSTAPPLEVAGSYDHPVSHIPSAGQSIHAAADFAVLPWNDSTVLSDFLAHSGDSVAGVIMEPILCNTGVILPDRGYLATVRELCDRYGALLIFDEVITGFRVGLSGAQGLLATTPDLSVVAKALGNGFPIAALVGKAQYMGLLGSGAVMHGGTYNANVSSVVPALATLDVLERDGGQALARMESLGSRLMAGLSDVAANLRIPLHVQGLGSVFNTAFSSGSFARDYRSYRASDADLLNRYVRALQDVGIRITSRGTWFMSVAHTEQEIDLTLAGAARALRNLKGTGVER